MQRIIKPTRRIGNAARKAAQKELRLMAGQTPLTKAGYTVVEEVVKAVKAKNKKRKAKRGDSGQMVKVPLATGSVIQSGEIKANGFDTRIVSGTETFLSVYRPENSTFDPPKLFDISPAAVGFKNLAQEAQNYQKYKFTSLSFIYVPVCSTTTQGQIIFGTLKDPMDPAPVSLEDTRAVRNSVSGPCWQQIELRVPVDLIERFVDGDTTSPSDVRFQIFRRFFVTSVAVPVGTQTGLWTVKYTCQLIARKPSSSSSSINTLEFNANSLPFSTMVGKLKSNKYFLWDPNNVLTFRDSGRFRVQLMISADTDQALPSLDINLLGDAIPYEILSITNGYKDKTHVNATILSVSISFTLPTRGATIDFSPLFGLTGSGSVFLSIEPSKSISD